MTTQPIENYRILISEILKYSPELPIANGSDLYVCDRHNALFEKNCQCTEHIFTKNIENEKDKIELESVTSFFTELEDNRNCENVFISCSDIRSIYEQVRKMERDASLLCECQECKGTGYVYYEYRSKNGKRYYLKEICPVCEESGKVISPENSVFVNLLGWYISSETLRQLVSVLDFYCPEEPSGSNAIQQDRIEVIRRPTDYGEKFTSEVDSCKAYLLKINEDIRFGMFALDKSTYVDDSSIRTIRIKDCRIVELKTL